jgi:hypothetical protein
MIIRIYTVTDDNYNVYVTANNPNMGTVIGSGDYAANDTVTITATPNAGYRFVQWNDGNTQNPRTITVTQDTAFTGMFDIIQRMVLHEVFTSSTCGPCNHGNARLKSVLNQVNDDTKWVCIKYQYSFPALGDPYFTTEGNTRGTFYGGIYAIPTLVGDGGYGSAYNGIPGAYSISDFNNMSAVSAIASMTASVTVDSISKTVTLSQMTINPVTNMNNPNLRFFAAIVEKKTVNNAKTNGETEFLYVMKKFLTNINGDVIDSLEENKPITLNDYTYTFNGNYRLPVFATSRDTINHNIEHSVEDFNNLMVVYWLQDIVTKEVYQAGKTDPNPGYTPFYYTVTTSVNNSSAGWVTGGPYYTPNTMAHLVAYTNNGYRFSHWSDGVTDNPRTFRVTQDTSFMAIFSSTTPGLYYVSAIANDTNMGTVTGSGEYAEDTSIVISAIPNNNCRFIQWNDGNTQNPRTITVTQDTTFTAIFDIQRMLKVSLTVNDTNMGTVTGAGVYAEDTSIIISAIPNAGYRFIQWHDGNTQNPRTITVTQDTMFTAIFDTIRYNLSLSINDISRGVVSGNGTYVVNSIATITAVPNVGYRFVSWDDGNKDSVRVITVTKDISLIALFGIEGMYYIYAAPVDPKMGNVIGSNDYQKSNGKPEFKREYAANSVASIEAIPNTGYRFIAWNDGNTDNPRGFTVTGDSIFMAIFDMGTAIKVIETSNIKIYPNPATDNIHITLPDNVQQGFFTLYDMQGKVLIRKGISSQETVSVSNLAAGVYIYNIITNKQNFTGKLTIDN